MKRLYVSIVTFSAAAFLICMTGVSAYAASAGSAAAYTRGGWVGGQYVALGGTAEAVIDDVFALYWNPAGLSAMASKNTKSPDEIRKKADSGNVSGITEDDLVRFSDTRDDFFFSMGASASKLDIQREAAFSAVAMKLFGGVFGAGAYGIYSDKIDAYDEAGVPAGSVSYAGTVGYIGYSRSFGITSVGITLKPLYEKIADAAYSGGACDVGVQAEILPFIKAGCVFQDIGIGTYPVSGTGLEKKYTPGAPTIRASVAYDSRTSDVAVMAGAVYRMEQEKFSFNAGARYNAGENVFLALGLADARFSAGAGCRLWACEVWYAFAFDRVNSGYDSTVSLVMSF